VVLDGDAPVFSGDFQVVDEKRSDEAVSNPWSTVSITSWRDAEEWPEVAWRQRASGADATLVSLRVRTNRGIRGCAGAKGRG
jgi:hypothetical protein